MAAVQYAQPFSKFFASNDDYNDSENLSLLSFIDKNYHFLQKKQPDLYPSRLSPMYLYKATIGNYCRKIAPEQLHLLRGLG